MSLPIAAVGPLKVETKPILMVSAASAGCAASASGVTPASQNAVFIFTPLLIIELILPCRIVGRLTCAVRGPLYQMPCFVREISGPQQAPTDRFGLEPSAHACSGLHHNSL